MQMFFEQETPGSCLLSLLQSDSSADLLNLITDKEISKYLPGIANIETLEESNELIALFVNAYKEGRGALWGIYISGSISLVGIIGICDLRFEPIIFYALSGQSRNRGIMTQCIHMVTEYTHRQHTVIKAKIDNENKASQRVLEKCGYSYESISGYYFHYRTPLC